MSPRKPQGDADTDVLAFGRRIKRLRALKKWTQTDLSAYTGIERGYLSRLETGKSEPCLRNMRVLADAFGISLAEMLSRL